MCPGSKAAWKLQTPNSEKRFSPSPELSGPRSAGAPLSTPFVGPIVMSVCWDRGRNERAATPRWGGFAVQRPLDSARMNGGVNVIVMQRDSSSFALVKTERPHCPETELGEKHCLRFRYFFSFSSVYPPFRHISSMFLDGCQLLLGRSSTGGGFPTGSSSELMCEDIFQELLSKKTSAFLLEYVLTHRMITRLFTPYHSDNSDVCIAFNVVVGFTVGYKYLF